MLILAIMAATFAYSQVNQWQDIYKVKKKDTLFGIARKYGITLPELMDANPDMKKEGYELKKGTTLFIPFAKPKVEKKPEPLVTNNQPVIPETVRIGVMLPLHNVDGDGRRMIEYYRGILMACDSLKHAGISTEIYAWNLPIDGDPAAILKEKGASKCHLIFGPLYTHQVPQLAKFCKENDIKLVIPFSINGDDVAKYVNIFQIYQNKDQINNESLDAFFERFPNHHTVLIDCNDSTSKKGIFTSGLRNRLDNAGRKYNITNLKSSEEMFAKAFSTTQPNVVVLNTGRSPELNVAMAKLNGLMATNPNLSITLFGYTEWLMYTKYQLNNFHKFNTYIPTTFYYNPLDRKTMALEHNYRKWFGENMQYAQPRFAITGYDHCMFFVKGIKKSGNNFWGTRQQGCYTPLQTPLDFRRLPTGGMQNRCFMLIHYTNNNRIESLTY